MAKNLRHSTIGFTVSGNIEQLERANKLLDKMPSKAKDVSKAFDGMSISDKSFKDAEKFQSRLDKMQSAINKLTDTKTVKVKTDANTAELDQFSKKVDHTTRTRTTKVKADTTEAESRLMKLNSRTKLYANVSESSFARAGRSLNAHLGGALDKAHGKLRSLNETTRESGNLFLKVTGAALVSNAAISSWNSLTTGIKEATKAGWEYSKQQDQMLATWTTLSGSKKSAKSMRSEINARAVKTGQDTDLVNEAAQGFYHLHSNRKETADMSNALFNMSDAVGLSQDQTKSVTQDMVHTLSGGVVQTGDLNVIGQYFPMFNEAMEKYESKIHHGTKVTGEDLRAMAKAGQISAKDYEKVFEQLGNVKYSKAAETMLTTFNGMQRTIKARVPALMSEITTPFMEESNPVASGISKWVSDDKTTKEFHRLGKAINTSTGQIFKSFGKAFQIKDGPKEADKLIGDLTVKVKDLGNYIAKHPDDIKKFFDTTKNIGAGTLKVYTTALKDMLPVLKIAGDFAAKHPKVFANMMGGLVVANTSANIFKHTLGGILTVVGGIGTAFKGLKTGASWMKKGTDFLGMTGKSVGQHGKGTAKTTLGKSVKNLSSKIRDAFSSGGTIAGKKFSTKANKDLPKTGTRSGTSFSTKAGKGITSSSRTGASHFASKVRSAGDYAGSTGGSKFGKTVRGAGWGAMGLAAGAEMFTGKTAKQRIHGAGTGLGTAIGGYLGGPAGAMIGGVIGGAIGDAFSKYYLPAKKAMDKNIKKYEDKHGKGSYRKIQNSQSGGTTTTHYQNGLAGNIKPKPGGVTGGHIAKNGMIMTGENGFEILQRGKKFGIIGGKGAQMVSAKAGDQIYKHSDAVKMFNGQFHHRLPNFANGTTALKSGNGETVKVTSNDGDLKKTATNTKKSMSTITKSITSGYSKSNQKSTKQLSSMRKTSNKTLKGLNSDAKGYTQKFQKNTVGDFDDAQKGSLTQLKQMRKGVQTYGKAMGDDFDNVMGKFPGYAKTGMKGAISSLNKGLSGVNSALGQFGGSKSVLNMAHYAEGSRGTITHDHLAVVNDATNGPRQEAIYDPQRGVMFPRGDNAIVPLKRGQQVINGGDTQRAFGKLPHYKKGTSSLKSLINKNEKDPSGAFKSEFGSQFGNGVNTAVGRAANGDTKGGTNSVGNPWSGAVWKAFANAMSGSGAGGAWGSPGMPVTNRFGAPRSFGSHDGVDFSSSLGSPILAVHGGTVKQIGSPGHGWPESQLGKIIWVKSSDGYQEIYQEFGGMNNIKVSAGDTIKTGQRIATLGALQGAGSGAHVHIGVSKGSVWDHGGSSTAGWLDVTKMHGKSTGTPKAKSKDSALDKYVKKQLAGQIKWIGKNLSDDDAGSVSGSLSGSQASKAKQLLALMEKAYSNTTKAGAAAIIGNWLLESGLNSGIRNSIGASGLGQWLGGRFTNLKNYASKHGKSWTNAGTQISFALNGEGSDSSIFKSVLSGHGSVSALATKFSNGWERGGYTAQHVANAMKVAKMLNLNANGGWSKNGKLNIFGEVNGEPEVAINPKRSTAESLIPSAIAARAKVNPNGIAGKLSKAMEYEQDAKARKSLYASVMSQLRKSVNSVTKTAKSAQPQIVISPTINFNGPVDKSTADYATKNITSEIKKIVLQVMASQYQNAISELDF